jgi:hypothetical protein
MSANQDGRRRPSNEVSGDLFLPVPVVIEANLYESSQRDATRGARV